MKSKAMWAFAPLLLYFCPAAAFGPSSSHAWLHARHSTLNGPRPVARVLHSRIGFGCRLPVMRKLPEDGKDVHAHRVPDKNDSALDLEDSKPDVPFLHAALGGGLAACTAAVVFHPLDTVKTLLQCGAGYAEVCALGLEGLYRGVLPSGLSAMPGCAARMGSYEILKRIFLRARFLRGMSPSTLIFLASACSVIPMCIVRAPLDLVKTCMQADASISVLGALQTAWGTGGFAGIAGMYRGVGLLLWRDVPFFGFNLLVYESLKTALLNRKAKATGTTDHMLSPLELFLIGFTAQGVAGFLTNPIDLLKTRVQVGAAANMAAALSLMLKEGGPLALLNGVVIRVAWIAPQGCIYYPVYETMLRLLGRKTRRKLEG